MPKNRTYREQLNETQIALIRDVQKDLPHACAEFLMGIETTTTPLTRLGYARDLKLFFHYLSLEIPEYGDLAADQWTYADIARVTARQIESYLNYLTLYYTDENDYYVNSDISKQRKLSAIRSFMAYLFKNELIPSNNAELVDLPKRREKEILRLEIDEMARLLDVVETGEATLSHQRAYNDNTRLRDLTILTMFLGTGIRVSELVGLNIDDINFETNGFLVTRKGDHQQILYFPEEVAEALKKYLAERKQAEVLPGHEDALFLSLQKKRITVRAVEYMVKKYALQVAPLKRRMSPHKLRSTFGTNLYRATGDIYLVADVLGHTDINTTRRHYAAMGEDMRKRAVKDVVLRETKKEKDDEDENPRRP